MKGEVLNALQTQIYREVLLEGGNRVVLVEPAGEHWPSLSLANHNVFRLDAQNEVVWQVRRDERGHVNWEVRHAHAKRKHAEGSPDGAYGPEGYWDPFRSLGMDERQALSPEPKSIYRPGCVVYLVTRWWEYVLDVETGIATCTGDQVK